MAINFGKSFERKFVKDWAKSFPKSFIFRLKDNTSEYRYNSANPCDFICFVNGTLYLVELKTVHGSTFPLSNLSQYDQLLGYKDVPGLVACVIIWYVDKDKVLVVPIQTIQQLKNDNKKSVNINNIFNDYLVIDVPSKKKRVYLDSDYSVIENLSERSI